MQQHPFHIFECLRALNSVMFLPVRDFLVYDNLFYVNDVILGKYGRLFQDKDNPYWLQIKRPDFETFPSVLPELAQWIADWGGHTPEQPPKVKKYYRSTNDFWQENQVDFSADSFLGERFDNEQSRVALWRNWLNDQWLPWAEDNLIKFSAIDAYENFWHIFKCMQCNQGQFELLWCRAVLCWRVDSMEIRYPLLVQKMDLQYSHQEGTFTVLEKSIVPNLEYEMLLGLPQVDIQELFVLEKQLLEQSLDLRNQVELEDFCQKLAKAIGNGCQIANDGNIRSAKITNQPQIYSNEQILLLRPLDGRKWRGELEGIVEAIDNQSTHLPEAFSAYYRDIKNKEENFERDWKVNYSNPFFPWDCPAAHNDVLRKLANNPLTVVQSPLKAQKEKLIANVLVHLLANGKKVLVTGNNNITLKKVSELIYKDFSDIAPLCASANGTDNQNIADLIACLRAHSQKMNFYTKEEIARELAQLQKKWGVFSKDLYEDKIQLQASRELEFTRQFSIGGKLFSAWQVASWLEENKENLNCIEDIIGHDKQCPLTEDEMVLFLELIDKISINDGKNLKFYRPLVQDLLTGEELEELFEQFAQLSKNSQQYKDFLIDCNVSQDLDLMQINNMLTHYQQALVDFPATNGDWLQEILKDIVTIGHNIVVWEDFEQSLEEKLQKIYELQSIVSDYDIIFPEQWDYRQIKESLGKLRVEFYKNAKLSLAFKLKASKRTMDIYKSCLLNGERAKNFKEIDLFLAKVEYLDETRKIVDKFNSSVLRVNGPKIDVTRLDLWQQLDEFLQQIKLVLRWHNKYLYELKKFWDKFAQNQEPKWFDYGWLSGMFLKIQALYKQTQEKCLTDKLNSLYELVLPLARREDVNPICYKLKDALFNKDIELWNTCLNKLTGYEKKDAIYEQLEGFYKRLYDIAPLWVDSLVHKTARAFEVENLSSIWQFAQAKSWLKKHTEGNKLDSFTESFYSKKAKEKDIIKDVASITAWYWQLARTTGEEKRVIDFLLSRADINYGNEKKDNLFYDFLRQAEFWRLSLPAWIMPINTLIDTAGPFDYLFDVIIIDASEKCDIFSLCLFLRARKVIVIGDNMSFGNVLPVQGRAAASLLLEKFLLGLPGKVKFELNDNLYNFALRICETKPVLLKEIGFYPKNINAFCNSYCYEDNLLLLPQADNSDFDDLDIVKVLVEPVQLIGNTNKTEAQAVVEVVHSFLGNKEYFSDSIGIFTFSSAEQKQLLEQMLFERIDEQEIFRHDIVCSLSENYIGGKKDIVIISFVCAKVAEFVDLRCLNLLLGLANKKVVLVHSFLKEQLTTRSAVFSLLDYKSNSVEDFKEKSNVEIIKNLVICIKNKGYNVMTEYFCDSFSHPLDIVVSDAINKVAIIIDGLHDRKQLDALFEQEMQLVRYGWHFYHIRACDFYCYRDAVEQKLWQFLAKTGLKSAN